MNLPLHVLCKALAPSVPTPLVSESAWARVVALTEKLPPIWRWGYLETRLHDDPRVDLLVDVWVSNGGREAVAKFLASEKKPAILGPALPLLEAWLETATLIHEEVSLIFLEYDLIPGGVPAPFVQFCVDRHHLRSESHPALAPSLVRRVCEEAFRRLPGSVVEPTFLDTLERCARLLPPGGRVLHLGSMPQRGTNDIRMVAPVPTPDIPDWLEAIGWPGRKDGLGRMLELIGPDFSRISVQLDLGERVRPSLAMEYYRPSKGGHEADWEGFATRLASAGIGSPEKIQAALDWPGDCTYDLPEAAWFVNIQRHLDIKVVLHPDGRLEAKAYLAFSAQHVLF